MKGPEEAKARCRDCQRYDEDRNICRRDQTVRHPTSYCEGFRMKLADHYVPNPWDLWKKEAERKAAAAKTKSGGD